MLLFIPRKVHIGTYDFEELSPAVSRYPNFYALMVEPRDNRMTLEYASFSAAVDLATKLRFENFIFIHTEAVKFNPAAFKLWTAAFNIRGQNAQVSTAPDKSGSVYGYFMILFMFNKENEASQYALLNSRMEGNDVLFNVAQIRNKYRQIWQSPEAASVDLKAQARLRLTFNESMNESVNVITFQNNDSKRWPFLLAIDTARQEALAHGFSYFIVLDAHITGEMAALQVRTRYLYNREVPDDLYKKGYRSFMIWPAKNETEET